MKRTHKYFKNLRYKQKLESMYGTNRHYWNTVYFTTKEPDYWLEQKNSNRPWYKGPEKEYGKDYYVYYEKPSVPYSIREYYTKGKRSKVKKFLKRYSNKVIRQHALDDVRGGVYKKYFDIPWTLD